MDWVAPAVLIVLTVTSMVAARRWLWRRWLENGMSPTRVALLSVVITYLPILVGLWIWSWITGRPMDPGDWLIILAVLAVPVATGFGMRRAVVQYMERYVLPEARRREKRS